MTACICSDGATTDRARCLKIDGLILQAGPDNVDDLLPFETDDIWAGSVSLFSCSAAFLGNMLMAWLRTAAERERATSADAQIVDLGFSKKTLPQKFFAIGGQAA